MVTTLWSLKLIFHGIVLFSGGKKLRPWIMGRDERPPYQKRVIINEPRALAENIVWYVSQGGSEEERGLPEAWTRRWLKMRMG